VVYNKDTDTVTAEGLNPCSLVFALELQRALPIGLNAIDMDNFNVALRDFQNVEQLTQAVSA